VAFPKAREPRRQPVERLAELAVQDELVRRPVAAHDGDLRGDLRQRRADHLPEPSTFIGQEDRTVPALEQRGAEKALELTDLLAHRGLGHAELLGRAREALQARGRLERQQARQRRQRARGVVHELRSCEGDGNSLVDGTHRRSPPAYGYSSRYPARHCTRASHGHVEPSRAAPMSPTSIEPLIHPLGVPVLAVEATPSADRQASRDDTASAPRDEPDRRRARLEAAHERTGSRAA